jgi:peptide/nickel transport system substrate-binding protein/oligopeptide transport system substrate-binding protein
VRVQTVEYPRYFGLVESGEFMISTITWIGDFADPMTFLEMWTTDSNLNASRYSSAEYDRLIRSAMGQTGETRYETLAEAERLLLHESIVLPIEHSPAINLISLDLIAGWYPNPLDIHPFRYITFSRDNPVMNVAWP